MTKLFIAFAGIVALLLFVSPVSADDKATLSKMVLDGLNDFNSKDIASFEKLHSQDDSVVHIDAGEGQITVGWPASKKAFEESMKMDMKLSNQKDIALNVDGNSAWGVWTFDTTMTMEGKPMTTLTRLTLVFKKTGGNWLVTHSHVSIGVPPPPAK